MLKNNQGTDETRIRTLDYGIQFNKLFYNRVKNNQNISLFSTSEVPGLYDNFFKDQTKFEELYVKYENNKKIRRKTIPARDLLYLFLKERKETSRIYFMNVDHANDHGSFIATKAPIKQSNLCTEITLPTEPFTQPNLFDDTARISLCTLAAINLGKIKTPEDFEIPCTIAVRALDALLDYQNYPVLAAELSTQEYRPLGVGIINLAYFLAKNNFSYDEVSKEGLQFLHEYMEAWSYYLIKASVDLAEEKGACKLVENTKYSQGILPIDTYHKNVDKLVDPIYKKDWQSLRNRLQKFGIRNSTLMALMPSETSAQVANATNGIEPPRALVSVKGSKDGSLPQVVPEIRKLKNKYNLLWDQKRPLGYLKICAVMQKFIDQSISTNTSYNPQHFPNEKIPMTQLITDFMYHHEMGLKTGYYLNTKKINTAEDEQLPQLPSAELEDEECEACVI